MELPEPDLLNDVMCRGVKKVEVEKMGHFVDMPQVHHTVKDHKPISTIQTAFCGNICVMARKNKNRMKVVFFADQPAARIVQLAMRKTADVTT